MVGMIKGILSLIIGVSLLIYTSRYNVLLNPGTKGDALGVLLSFIGYGLTVYGLIIIRAPFILSLASIGIIITFLYHWPRFIAEWKTYGIIDKIMAIFTFVFIVSLLIFIYWLYNIFEIQKSEREALDAFRNWLKQ